MSYDLDSDADVTQTSWQDEIEVAPRKVVRRFPMSYDLDSDADVTQTSWQDEIEVAPRKVVQRFGAPIDRGDAYKISGRYIFVCIDGEVFTVYDWKATSLFDPDCQSPLQFWNSHFPELFSIGGALDDVEEFKAWFAAELDGGA